MALNFRGTNFPGTSKNFYCAPDGIDLRAVAEDRVRFPNTVFTPRFAAVQIWDYDTVDECFIVHLMFQSGVVNQVGARSEARRDYWFANLRARFDEAFTYATYKPPTQRGTMCAATACLPDAFNVRTFLKGVDPSLPIGYDLERFPGVTVHLRGGRAAGDKTAKKRGATRLIVNAFPGSKKFVVTGTVDEAGARLAADEFVHLVSAAYEAGAATAAPPPPPPAQSAPADTAARAVARGRKRRAARMALAGDREPVALGRPKRVRRL